MRNHPAVIKLVLETASSTNPLGYDEAEELLRVRAQRDADAARAVKEIDEARQKAKADALALNTEMVGRLGLSLDQAGGLVAKLAADAELETWLARRVALTRAHERPPAHDWHPENI